MAPQTAAFAARSRSASASTIIASLPPSSRLYGISRSAARCAIFLPVRVDPVNWMKSASSTSADPVAPVPVRHSSTPGAPTSSRQPRTISRGGQRRELRRLDRDRRAGQQRGHRIGQGEQNRVVPRADDPDDRVRPVGDRELLARDQQAVRSRMRVGQELLRALSVVLEQVDRDRNLQGGLLPRLSRLALEQLCEALIVVEQPVTKPPDPFASAGRSQRLPCRLVARSRPTAARTSSAP